MIRFIRRCRGFWAIALAIALGMGCGSRVMAQPPLGAEIMPLAEKSLLLGVANAGDRVIAVGERGHILISDDYGRSWRQVPCPTRATLTAVTFVDEQIGWAVGHDHVILKTTNGGESWQHQHAPASLEDRFLDTFFLDAENGFVIGAYGVAFVTNNGGLEWRAVEISEDELHLNAMTRAANGLLYIAAEAGDLLYSPNEGRDWNYLDSPYDGSLFGLLPLAARTLLVYGLRGHVFRSTDSGVTWQEINIPLPVMIMDAVRLSNGAIVLAGQGKHFFVSQDGGRSFESWTVPVEGAADLVETPDGAVIAVGLNGAWRLAPPSATSQAGARR